MNVNLEKVLVFLVLAVFLVASVSSFIVAEIPVSREQAIGISRKSQLVQQGLLTSSSFEIEANYYNASRVEELQRQREQLIEQLNRWRREQGHGQLENVTKDDYWEFKVPEGHSVWEVIWWFNNPGFVGGYNAIVIIDAERAVIIDEPAGIGWR